MPTKIPIGDFYRNPDIAGFSVSPSATKLAWLQKSNGRLNIWVQDIHRTSAAVQITSEVERDIREYHWCSDNRIVYFRDFGGDENYQAFAINTDASGFVPLCPIDGVSARMVAELHDRPDYILIALNDEDPSNHHLYLVNTLTGTRDLVFQNPGGVVGWVCDRDGDLRAYLRMENSTRVLYYSKKGELRFQEMLRTTHHESFEPLHVSRYSDTITAASAIGRDKQAIVTYDAAEQREESVVFQHPEVDTTRIIYSEKKRALLAVAYEDWKLTYHFLDDDLKATFDQFTREHGAEDLYITSTDTSETIFTVVAKSDRQSATHYLYDTDKRLITFLGVERPWLKPEDLAPMEPISYVSRDGLTIHGYLTRPIGYQAPGPLVVHPHGGPWVRDMWGYSPDVQFLANRGYAVLQINYRGSTGYGQAFLQAGYKQWGRNMQNDLSDGVQWAIEQGITEHGLVGIFGASYGGYATLAGLTFTPDLYACGVDYCGVSNLFTFFESFPPYWLALAAEVHEMVGHPEHDKELMREISPVFHADKITAPLFVVQGARDPRVRKSESDQIVEALRARGVDVEYMVKDDEGHGFHNEENRADFFRALEAFLDKHLGSKRAS